MSLDLVLRIATKFLLPFILVFALYVQFHGDFGPGGGFQAGVIASGMIILYALIFGLPAAQRVLPMKVVEFCVPLGVLLYASVGLTGMLLGGNFMEYTYLAKESAKGHHIGIFLVELGVLITVWSSMTAIFYAFAGRERT